MTNEELKVQAARIWGKYRQADLRPTQEERDIMTQAYHASVLPRDRDYNVSQWVEDGCPAFL